MSIYSGAGGNEVDPRGERGSFTPSLSTGGMSSMQKVAAGLPSVGVAEQITVTNERAEEKYN